MWMGWLELSKFQTDAEEKEMNTFTAASTLCCAWCGKHLGNATSVIYLNGNQPVCDLCLGRNLKMETGCPPTFWPLPRVIDAWADKLSKAVCNLND